MKNVITKSDLNHAIYVKQTVVPALEAVQKITLKTVDGDQEGFNQIQSFACLLKAFLVMADETIAQAEALYDDRPKELIDRACFRLAQIPSDILRAEFEVRVLPENYSLKVAELKKQGFNDDEISQIVTDPKAEVEKNVAILAALKAEIPKIHAFLDDAPRYDVGLLDGTGVQISIKE